MSEQEQKRRIRIFQSVSTRLWYFHIQADNNEIISASEAYGNKKDMTDMLEKYFPDWKIEEEQLKVYDE